MANILKGLTGFLSHSGDDIARGASPVAEDAARALSRSTDDAAKATGNLADDMARAAAGTADDATRGGARFAGDAAEAGARAADDLAGKVRIEGSGREIADMFARVGRGAGDAAEAGAKATADAVQEGAEATAKATGEAAKGNKMPKVPGWFRSRVEGLNPVMGRNSARLTPHIDPKTGQVIPHAPYEIMPLKGLKNAGKGTLLATPLAATGAAAYSAAWGAETARPIIGDTLAARLYRMTDGVEGNTVDPDAPPPAGEPGADGEGNSNPQNKGGVLKFLAGLRLPLALFSVILLPFKRIWGIAGLATAATFKIFGNKFAAPFRSEDEPSAPKDEKDKAPKEKPREAAPAAEPGPEAEERARLASTFGDESKKPEETPESEIRRSLHDAADPDRKPREHRRTNPEGQVTAEDLEAWLGSEATFDADR